MSMAPTPTLYANTGPAKGLFRYNDVIGAIGVLGDPTELMPIGEAYCRTWDEQGNAVFRLRVRKEGLPGGWLCRDRRFEPTDAPLPLLDPLPPRG